MIVAESKSTVFRPGADGVWRFEGWAPSWVTVGVLDRRSEVTRLAHHLPSGTRFVQAEQVHGASIAIVDRLLDSTEPIAGCDALVTARPGMALLIRTADCIPLFLVDPSRGVAGIAHVGWRGLGLRLPQRLLAAFRHGFHSRPEALRVAVGPAIRACCYEVESEFVGRFAPFVQPRDGRLYCDLVGAAIDQLRQGGVPARHVLDSQRCTSCESEHWFSTRREGQGTGRLTSFIMVRP